MANAHSEVVVVTGASSGIGRAIVRHFAGPGVALGLIARGEDGLEAAAAEVRAAGGTIVQVGSAMAYRGIPLQAPYSGAKQAIGGFQEALRCELRAAAVST